jgi:hypothetical protein
VKLNDGSGSRDDECVAVVEYSGSESDETQMRRSLKVKHNSMLLTNRVSCVLI